MDASFNQQQPQLDLSKLSDYDKRELQQSLTNEMQKAKIQECMSAARPKSLTIMPAYLLSFPSYHILEVSISYSLLANERLVDF